jgi:hypothetical protein
MIFPDRVFGRSGAQMIRLGRANLPILIPTWSRSSLVSAGPVSASPKTVTYATTGWPEISSSTAMTAASATVVCATSADSISAVDSRCPDTLITSSIRPVIQKYPSVPAWLAPSSGSQAPGTAATCRPSSRMPRGRRP